EFLVFTGGVFHALNGIRLVFVELGKFLTRPARPIYPFTNAALKQRPLVYLVFLLSAVIVAYGGYELITLAYH
ncbi:MAG: hypothetical protein U9P14_09565, partial [Gemmatimonadota bacterium]|nr:hypothetical protein [Gemmatimonadota bacterium]